MYLFVSYLLSFIPSYLLCLFQMKELCNFPLVSTLRLIKCCGHGQRHVHTYSRALYVVTLRSTLQHKCTERRDLDCGLSI